MNVLIYGVRMAYIAACFASMDRYRAMAAWHCRWLYVLIWRIYPCAALLLHTSSGYIYICIKYKGMLGSLDELKNENQNLACKIKIEFFA